jgi:MoxR-like ATPase
VTIRARERPAVIMTSNRTRELSDALRRRCLYLWIDYPTRAQELAILRARLPGIDARLAEQIRASWNICAASRSRKCRASRRAWTGRWR